MAATRQPDLTSRRNSFDPWGSYQSASTPAPTPAPASAFNPLAQPTSPYRTDLGDGWNAAQYATDDTTGKLTGMFGGTAGKTASTLGTGSPFGIPQQNVIDFGDGFVGNAGLTQQLIDFWGGNTEAAKRGLAAMANMASGSTMGIGTDPSLAGYDPAFRLPITAGQVSPFTGRSTAQAQMQGATPQAPPINRPPTTQPMSPFNIGAMGQNPLLFSFPNFGMGGGGGGGSWWNGLSGMGGGGMSSVAQLLNMIRMLRPQQTQPQLPTFAQSMPNMMLYPSFF